MATPAAQPPSGERARSRAQFDHCARGRLFRLSRGRLIVTSDRRVFRLRRARSPGAAEFTATQAVRKVGVVEPGGKRSGKPAGSEHTGVAAGYEVAERYKPDQPPLHLPGVCLDRQVDVVARVVLAYADRATLDLEPALGRADAGQH